MLVPLLVALLGIPYSFAAAAGGSAPPNLAVTSAAGAATALSAAPSVSVASGVAPLPVRFSANAAGGAPPYHYYWSFGDREASWIATPTHTFLTAGQFQTNLTVWDSVGATVPWSQVIDVASGADLRVNLTAYLSPMRQGQMVHVNVTTTGGSPPYVYSWAGAIPGCAPQGGSSFDCLVNLTACSYPFFDVWVHDSLGNLAQGSLNLNVTGAPPCIFRGPGSLVPGDAGLTIGLVLLGPIGVAAAVGAIFSARRRRRLRNREPRPEAR